MRKYLFQAYRIEPLIYEHYSQIPPVKINRATKLSEKEIAVESKGDSYASGWLKSLWGLASKSPPMVAEYADGQVQLPKGECEKADGILKEQKGQLYPAVKLNFGFWPNRTS